MTSSVPLVDQAKLLPFGNSARAVRAALGALRFVSMAGSRHGRRFAGA